MIGNLKYNGILKPLLLDINRPDGSHYNKMESKCLRRNVVVKFNRISTGAGLSRAGLLPGLCSLNGTAAGFLCIQKTNVIKELLSWSKLQSHNLLSRACGSIWLKRQTLGRLALAERQVNSERVNDHDLPASRISDGSDIPLKKDKADSAG